MDEERNGSQENILWEDQSSTSLAHSLTHPSGTIFRCIGLALLCFLGFGSYFCYDNPGALQNYIEKDLNISESQYLLLYSVYSLPNVFLGFIGGFLIDRVFGVRLGSDIYMGLTLIGQLLFSTGAWMGSLWIMLLGRFIFGVGAESLAVAQNNYAVLWFKGKVLNMVFGLQLSFARIGSTVNFIVMDPLYNWVQTKYEGKDGLAITLYLATLTCVFSFICSVILGLMDRKAERIIRVNNTITNDPVKISDVYYFNGKFWLLNIIIVFYYVAVFIFIQIGKTFFMDEFHMDNTSANFICSIVYLISGFASPILGFLIDRTGRNLFWVILGITFTIVAHCCLTFFIWLNPYVAMICMGISYSILASSLWPLISLVIPEHQLGTAYGVVSALQNSGLALFPYVVGSIVENFGYFWSEIFFISVLVVALITTIFVFIWDYFGKDILNMTPNARIAHQQKVLGLDAKVVRKKSAVLNDKIYSNYAGSKIAVVSSFGDEQPKF